MGMSKSTILGTYTNESGDALMINKVNGQTFTGTYETRDPKFWTHTRISGIYNKSETSETGNGTIAFATNVKRYIDDEAVVITISWIGIINENGTIETKRTFVRLSPSADFLDVQISYAVTFTKIKNK